MWQFVITSNINHSHKFRHAYKVVTIRKSYKQDNLAIPMFHSCSLHVQAFHSITAISYAHVLNWKHFPDVRLYFIEISHHTRQLNLWLKELIFLKYKYESCICKFSIKSVKFKFSNSLVKIEPSISLSFFFILSLICC